MIMMMMMYRCAIREIQTKLEVLDDEFSVEYKRNPISFIKTRIKKPQSIYNKLQRRGYEEISKELLHSAQAIIKADNEMQQIKNKIGMFHDI